MDATLKGGWPDLTENEGDPDLTEKISGMGKVFAGDEVADGLDLGVSELCECLLWLSSGWSTATEPP